MESVSSSELPVLDLTTIEVLRSLGAPGEPDMFVEIARVFLEDAPIHLSALDAAIAARTPELVAATAHRLRGSALEIGAVRMAPVCAAIEYTARGGSLDEAVRRAEILNREFAVAQGALAQVIQ
jgi:HPt (histidine-containing phosphotransfer) domain-containing protein